MLTKILSVIHPLQDRMDIFEKRHPVAGMLLFQAAVAILLTGTVGAAAMVGGAVIWGFYQLIGML